MDIFKQIVKQSRRIRKQLNIPSPSKLKMQERELRKLLSRAVYTRFGKEFDFEKILYSENIQDEFRNKVPLSTYKEMSAYWELARHGARNICWPGKVKYFALSSGTSEGSSKFIPVTNTMLKAIQRASLRQYLRVTRANLPIELLTKQTLLIGGSTSLEYDGISYAGDLSGITTGNQPFLFDGLTKPDNDILAKKNWSEKIESIVQDAPKWDVGFVAGVPAWVQIIFEKIIEKYKLNNIHEMWPNLSVFIHGGVSMEPYKNGFQRLLARPIYFFETYLASEGFLAYQAKLNARGMQLILNNGIYFEFIPFDEKHFDDNGELLKETKTLLLSEVELGKEYAVVISTCAGTWRYLIGDTIRFVSLKDYEIKITGRTKHFLSMCGEHLSVDNMNKAVNHLATHFDAEFNEFTVIGRPHNQGLFAHHWYLACDKELDEDLVTQMLDAELGVLNDDYRTERQHALGAIFVTLVPNAKFHEFLRLRGKEGGQVKFPRVLKGNIAKDWEHFLETGDVLVNQH